MRYGKLMYGKVFFSVSALAALFVLIEIIMQSFGTSICPTAGCKVVAQHARFGDLSILLIGIATFSLLGLLSGLSLFAGKTGLERFINLILIVSLASEGFLTGYQAFAIHTPCVFCLIVFGVIVTLSLIRLLSGERDLIAGFASLAAVFATFYLVLPANAPVNLPENERLILFYSKDCGHCDEIRKEFDEKKIAASHLEIKDYTAFLKNLGIEQVPTLLVADPYHKQFLTGTSAIRKYLAACAEAEKTSGQAAKKSMSGGTPAAPEETDPGASLNIFGRQGAFPFAGEPAADAGVCQQDQACQ